jgi:hypothetical protein
VSRDLATITSADLVRMRQQNEISIECGVGSARRAEIDVRNSEINHELDRRRRCDEEDAVLPGPLKLFTAHLKVAAIVQQRRGQRAHDTRIRLALLAADEADAERRAREWFKAARAANTWSILFGTGKCDAIVADLADVFVSDEPTGVAVVGNA